MTSLNENEAAGAARQSRCFACDRPLGRNPKLVDTRDGQTVYVGSECFKHIAKAGDNGWQPPKGWPHLGPRLYLIDIGSIPTERGAAFAEQILREIR